MIFLKRFSRPAIAALFISAAGHIGAFLQWKCCVAAHVEIIDFDAVFVLCAVVSFLFSCLMFLIGDIVAYRWFFAIRAVTVLFIFSTFDEVLPLALMMIIPLLVESATYEDYPANLVTGLAVLFGSVPVKLMVFAREIDSEVLRDLVIYLFTGCMIHVVFGLQTRYRQRLIFLSREVVRLDGAVSEISDASHGYLREANIAEERSIKHERDRITRELHDSIGYTLTNLIMMLEAAKALVGHDADKLVRTLQGASEQVQQGLTETRKSLHLLRKQEIRSPEGLPAIERLVRTFEAATKVMVKTDYGSVPLSCGDEIDSFLYHFVQEGLTNSFRHGKAKTISVHFSLVDDHVCAIVRDNGFGSDEIREGIGIMGMRERLGNLGGTLHTRNAADGFELKAEVPFHG